MAALNEALSSVDRKSVKALSISGQQHGFVPVDKSGEVCVWLLVLIARHTDIVMPACCAKRCATPVLSKFLPVQGNKWHTKYTCLPVGQYHQLIAV